MLSNKGHKAEVKDSRNVQINQADIINQYINQTEVAIPKYLTSPPLRNNFFIGREDKLNEISDQLNKDKAFVILNGWGGMGKTTVATEYYFRNIEKYNHLIWLRIGDSLPEALANPSLSKILKIDFIPGNKLIYNARMVSHQLTNLKGTHLMILDNANNIEEVQRHLDLLPQINWKIMLISRGNLSGLSNINIDVLKVEDARHLFYTHYPIEKNDPELEPLLQMIGRHTLTIELMAKIANNGDLSIAELTKVLKKEGLSSENLDLNLNTNYDKKNNKLKEILVAAFKYSAILDKENQTKIFKHFILLPSVPISLNHYSELTGIESNVHTKNSLIELVSMGWIKEELLISEEKREKRYSVHPLVAETVRSTIEIKEAEVSYFIKKITNKINVDKYKTRLDASQWLDFGRVLSDYFRNSGDSIILSLQNNLAMLYNELGELKLARNRLEKVLELDKKKLGEDHYTMVAGYSNLAMIYKDLGEIKLAEEMMEKVLASNERNLDRNDPAIARSFSFMALVYMDQGKFNQARDSFEKTLLLHEKNLGKSHPATARGYSNLAMAYKNLGELNRAKELMEKALEFNEKYFGEDHPTTAVTYSNLGQIYGDLDELNRAKELIKKALMSDQKNFGEDHPTTTKNYFNLAMAYKNLGELNLARELMEKALECNEKNFREDHPSTAQSRSNLGMIYVKLGEMKLEKEVLEKALTLNEKSYGKDHPATAQSYSDLALIYKRLGKMNLAKDLLEKALASNKKNFGENHRSTAISYCNLASYYMDVGKLNPARKLLEKGYGIANAVLGANHPITNTIKSQLETIGK